MPQQKGAKRAVKVQKRARRLEAQRREANFKRLEREAEGHDHEGHDHDHDHNHEHEKSE
jgi:hypothetical protein